MIDECWILVRYSSVRCPTTCCGYSREASHYHSVTRLEVGLQGQPGVRSRATSLRAPENRTHTTGLQHITTPHVGGYTAGCFRTQMTLSKILHGIAHDTGFGILGCSLRGAGSCRTCVRVWLVSSRFLLRGGRGARQADLFAPGLAPRRGSTDVRR